MRWLYYLSLYYLKFLSSFSIDAKDSTQKLTEIPFQLVVKYTDSTGAEALRVISKAQPVTTDRSVAEQGAIFFAWSILHAY